MLTMKKEDGIEICDTYCYSHALNLATSDMMMIILILNKALNAEGEFVNAL